MPDTVTKTITNNGDKWHTVVLTNVSDGAGESAVVKVDKSALTNSRGQVVDKLSVYEIAYDIQGFTSVKLAYDHTTDDTIAVLSGSGVLSLAGIGGLVDPVSAGGTGDILLTTTGGESGSSYTITLVCKKKYA